MRDNDNIAKSKDDDENEEIYETLAAILDQYADDAQVMHPFLDVLRVLCQVDSNRTRLKQIEGVYENMDLTAKMNKRNVGMIYLSPFSNDVLSRFLTTFSMIYVQGIVTKSEEIIAMLKED